MALATFGIKNFIDNNGNAKTNTETNTTKAAVDIETTTVATERETIFDDGVRNDGVSINAQRLSDTYRSIFGDLKYITSSNKNIAVINRDNELYIWGDNEYGQVGCGNKENQMDPVFVMNNVDKVCLADDHVAAITRDGELFMWGRNSDGQLGNGNQDDQTKPLLIMNKVMDVALNKNASGAICFNGDVYGWGAAISNGSEKDQLTPTLIAENMSSITMGGNEGAVLNEAGDLYLWGMEWTVNYGYEYGYTTPTKIMSNVKSVSIGEDMTLGIVMLNGDLYMWGDNKRGEVGSGDEIHTVLEPVDVMDGVKEVFVGDEHTMAICVDGTLYGWGCNSHGQTGAGKYIEHRIPRKAADNVKNVCVGYSTTAFTDTEGHLYMCGYNGYLKLTGEYESLETNVIHANNITAITIFKDDTYAIDEEGSLYRWRQTTDRALD